MKTKTFLTAIAFLAISFATEAQNWFQVPSGTSQKLNTIHFPSANVGYIGGNDSLLLKTTDGGINWSPLNFTGVTFYPNGENILNLQFLTEDIGFMTIGPYSGSYKTIDGGMSWTLLATVSNMCYNQGLFFIDEYNGFIGGSGCFQGELINHLSAGVWLSSTINSSTSSAMNYVVDIDFHNSTFGLAASRSGYILRTTDGGINWDTIPSSVTMNPLTSIIIISDTLAYAGYESINTGFGLYISTDGGITWNEDINSATFFYPDFMSLHQSGNGTIYTGGVSQGAQQGVVFESPGNISTWNYSIVDENINDLSSYNDSIVFAVGDSGYIIVNKILSPLNIDNLTKMSDEVNLYPNPTSEIVNIELPFNYQMKNSFVRIFSSLGKVVRYEPFIRSIDISDLQKGIYIFEITNEEFAIRKKLVKE